MFNKNLCVLLFAQIFSFSAGAITVFLSGLIGLTMIDEKSYATFPAALMIVGTAFGSIFAAYIMSIKGRKFGFMLATLITSFSSLLAAYAVYEFSFLIFCFANFLIGIGHAFTAQYRFAAAESVDKKFIPSAISYILFASIGGALLAPNIATFSRDLIPNTTYTGSYILLSILTVIPFFIFIFYSNEKLSKETDVKSNHPRSYMKILFQPKFFQAVVASGFAYCIMSFLMTATPISMHVLDNISIEKTGFVIMFHIIAMFVPSIFTGSLIKKFGYNKIMYTGIIILFLSIIFNFIEQSFYNYIVGLIFLGLGWNLLFISGSSLLIISYKSEEKFSAQGMNDFVVFSTQALGALSAGLLISLFGWKTINLLCIPLLLIILLTILISEYREKSTIKKL